MDIEVVTAKKKVLVLVLCMCVNLRAVNKCIIAAPASFSVSSYIAGNGNLSLNLSLSPSPQS